MTRHLIIGASGQDGRYLADYLKAKGDNVLGLDKSGLFEGETSINDGLCLTSKADMDKAISLSSPDHIYYLAAYHHAAEQDVMNDGDTLQKSLDIHLLGLAHIFDGVLCHKPDARLFYAGSSHLFKAGDTSIIDENTPMAPNCHYGITKAAGVHYCRMMRDQHGLFTSSGFLFNHESPLRGQHFLTTKLVRGAYDIQDGKIDHITLASLDAEVDWGFAGDYVKAMNAALLHKHPEDYVIASGTLHTVRDFASKVFSYLGLEWQNHVQVNEAVLKKGPIPKTLCGNANKIKSLTGWEPEHNLDDLVALLMSAEKERRYHG